MESCGNYSIKLCFEVQEGVPSVLQMLYSEDYKDCCHSPRKPGMGALQLWIKGEWQNGAGTRGERGIVRAGGWKKWGRGDFHVPIWDVHLTLWKATQWGQARNILNLSWDSWWWALGLNEYFPVRPACLSRHSRELCMFQIYFQWEKVSGELSDTVIRMT